MNLTEINSSDRLVLFGCGLFETLKVSESGIEVPQLHWERLQRGAEKLALNLPTAYDEWLETLKSFLHAQPLNPPYAVRLTLSGGAAAQQISPAFFYQARSIPYTRAQYEEGIKLCLLASPRNEFSPLTKIKSTNYLENLLGKEEANSKGAFEGLWLNTKGFLAEATMSNLFFIKDNILYTPSLLCGCLPGTRRALVLELASELGLSVREGQFTVKELEGAQEVFLTNALMGIMPVAQFEQVFYQVGKESVISRLHQSLKSKINEKS